MLFAQHFVIYADPCLYITFWCRHLPTFAVLHMQYVRHHICRRVSHHACLSLRLCRRHVRPPSPLTEPIARCRSKVYLRIDNSKCGDTCFRSSEKAAEYVAYALRRGTYKPTQAIYSVACESTTSTDEHRRAQTSTGSLATALMTLLFTSCNPLNRCNTTNYFTPLKVPFVFVL